MSNVIDFVRASQRQQEAKHSVTEFELQHVDDCPFCICPACTKEQRAKEEAAALNSAIAEIVQAAFYEGFGLPTFLALNHNDLTALGERYGIHFDWMSAAQAELRRRWPKASR